MKTEEIKTFKIEFEGGEVDSFKTAIKKIDNVAEEIGFNNPLNLNGDELKIIRDLNKKLNP